MPRDHDASFGAVTRRVTAVVRDGKPAREITLERIYDTTPDDLWDALTNARRLPRWFLPISGKLETGGRYQFEGSAGGIITECDPPRRVRATWEFGGAVSWVDLRLAPDGDGCRMTLSHVCPVDDHWRKYGPWAVGIGWDLTLLGLADHLSDSEVGRFDEDVFTASADGQAYVGRVSEDWGRAVIAAGEDQEQAATASRRTTAFYTGTGEEA
jgi:uncharacterized protein YndB with AHSA1/START domain